MYSMFFLFMQYSTGMRDEPIFKGDPGSGKIQDNKFLEGCKNVQKIFECKTKWKRCSMWTQNYYIVMSTAYL